MSISDVSDYTHSMFDDDERDERDDVRIEWADGKPTVAGWYATDRVVYDGDGAEVSRERCAELAYFAPDSKPASGTEEQTQKEIDELAVRRSQATGKIAVVATFSSSGKATVTDIGVDEDGTLVPEPPITNVPITPSRLRKIPPLVRKLRIVRPTRPTGASRPRERRARRVAASSRASPSALDPPPRAPRVLAGLTTHVLGLVARWRRRG
jgi:hypothetical protein